MGFDGIVLSEGGGITTIISEKEASTEKEAGQMAAKAGVDVGISMEDSYLGELVSSVKEGLVPMKSIDDAVRHILKLEVQAWSI